MRPSTASTQACICPIRRLPSWSQAPRSATDPNSNNSLFQDETYSKLIAQASSEPDAAKRKALYSHLNDILLDESFIMVLAGAPPTLVAHANVTGIAPSA